MIKLNVFKQKTDYTCGPSCLKMVFDYFGLKLTEEQIAKLAGTTVDGTAPEKLVSCSNKLGFEAHYKVNSSISDIKKFLNKRVPVIVDWFSVDEGHYSVVVGMDSQNIYLADPEFGKIKSMKLNDFYRVWFDFSGDFIRSIKDVRPREMIVIFPRKRLKGTFYSES